MGPPGSGKGTQAEYLKNLQNLTHISTGDILRNEIKNTTLLGNMAKDYMNKGLLVPDELVTNMVYSRIDNQIRLLFDGFPRTISQAESLEKKLSSSNQHVKFVIYIDVPEDEIIKRLSIRAICSSCQRSYVITPKTQGTDKPCVNCGGNIEVRQDDDKETLIKRLTVYKHQTEPLLQYYKEKGILKHVSGVGSKETVRDSIQYILNDSYI